MPLYGVVYPMWQCLRICFVATLGDVFFVAVIYFLLVFFHKDFSWYKKRTLPDIFIIVSYGFIVATFIEWHALALGKWSYNFWMPIVPYLGIGLTPFLQLAVLTVATFEISRLLPQDF